MNYNEQTDALAMELDNLLIRFREAFDINQQTMIGVLEAKKMELLLGPEVGFEADPDLLDELSDDDEPGFDIS